MVNRTTASGGLHAVLIAQFLSALADNALLFVAIAMLKARLAPSWQVPMLQEFFVIAFILLAPFVGGFADGFPKGRVMLMANAMKLIGASTLYLGVNPLFSYGLVGIGAAAYSPAKYGILRQLVPEEQLVKANGLMEGSTIVAILLGAVLGGMLADRAILMALSFVCACYGLAILANLFIPKLASTQPNQSFQPQRLLRQFLHALVTLWQNADARLSLLGTSVFWGAGSTLRLLLVAWVPVALLSQELSLAANLSGAVAIGIAIGAALAARFVALKNVNQVLPVGVSIGVLIIIFGLSTHLYAAIAWLILIGMAGGYYVVPLNALLQERGHETVGAGNAVAVQNFFENCTMLLLVALYVVLERLHTPVVYTSTLFGLAVFLAIASIAYVNRGRASVE